METGSPGAGTTQEDRHGRWLVILMVAVLAALILSWAAFFLLR
jgi:uncharacterized membrane protein YjjP (DUF1212 family)